MISRILPTNEYKYKPPIVETILKLNETKTEILDSYFTKNFIASELKIGKLTMRNIIAENKMYNNHYYIEYSKCPQELLNKYNKPINRIISANSKQIKQINPITNEIVIFNTLTEIYIKFGIATSTIIDAIKNNTVCSGFIWQYL